MHPQHLQGVLTVYKIISINIYCAFVGLDDKLHNMHDTYIKIMLNIFMLFLVYKCCSSSFFLTNVGKETYLTAVFGFWWTCHKVRVQSL